MPRQFLRHVVRSLRADSAGLWLADDAGEWLLPVAGYHLRPEQIAASRELRISTVHDGFYAEAIRSRRPIVSTDVMHDERIPRAIRDAAPHQTQLFVPIVTKNRMIGGFAVAWWEARRVLSDSELKLMDAIASQAGVALENAQLFRDNQRRVEELSVLHELSRAVTGQLDQTDLLDTIHQHVARVLDCATWWCCSTTNRPMTCTRCCAWPTARASASASALHGAGWDWRASCSTRAGPCGRTTTWVSAGAAASRRSRRT